jgi:adenylate kinase
MAALDAHFFDNQSIQTSEHEESVETHQHANRATTIKTALEVRTPGFPNLHILNLEGNKLGTSDHNFWKILGSLPM